MSAPIDPEEPGEEDVPTKVAEVLTEIFDRRGRLEEEDVYEEVQNPDHPIHHRYEWDTDVAARKWVLHQIGRDIRRVKMHTVDNRTGERRDFRAWVSHRQAGGLSGFIPTPQVMADPLMAKLLMAQIVRARAELMSKIHALMAVATPDVREQVREEFGNLL